MLINDEGPSYFLKGVKGTVLVKNKLGATPFMNILVSLTPKEIDILLVLINEIEERIKTWPDYATRETIELKFSEIKRKAGIKKTTQSSLVKQLYNIQLSMNRHKSEYPLINLEIHERSKKIIIWMGRYSELFFGKFPMCEKCFSVQLNHYSFTQIPLSNIFNLTKKYEKLLYYYVLQWITPEIRKRSSHHVKLSALQAFIKADNYSIKDFKHKILIPCIDKISKEYYDDRLHISFEKNNNVVCIKYCYVYSKAEFKDMLEVCQEEFDEKRLQEIQEGVYDSDLSLEVEGDSNTPCLQT